MKGKAMTVLDWQRRYGTEEDCAQALLEQRWPEGFRCPSCGHDRGYIIKTRCNWECSQCHRQTSLTSGIIQTNQHILDNCQQDAAQDTHCHGTPR